MSNVSILLRASTVALLLTGLAPLLPANEFASPATSAFAQNQEQAKKKTTTVRTTTTVRRSGNTAGQNRTTVRRTTVQTRAATRQRPAQVRTRATTSTRVYHRNNRWHSRPAPRREVFVFLGGPRVVVRGYGAGWCRGLHRGWHRAPGIGWHAGRHFGLYRC